MRRLATALTLGAVALSLLLAWMFAVLVRPAPPRTVVISSGPPDGAYHAFALRYRAHLARYGVDLVVKESSGSVENLARLRERRDGVQVALVQGGIASAAQARGVMTLGSMFYEPVWIFMRSAEPLDTISQLRGRRIAIGGEGSGTRALALRLLSANGMDEKAARLDASGGMDAAEKLESGAVSVGMFVSAPEAPAIRVLLRSPGVHLADIRRADAYERHFPYLHKVVLPVGALDLERNIPAREQTLVAVTANLLAVKELHPVIIDLLLEAAREVHGGSSLLNRPGEFPELRDREFPSSPDAERIYRGQYSFLRHYVPFWLAIWVQRFAFFVIPLLALFPLLRYIPAAYQWGVRRRIYRWYGELKFLEQALRREGGDPEQHRARLSRIEERVNALKVPLAYSSEYYTLKLHIGLVRQLIDARPGQGR